MLRYLFCAGFSQSANNTDHYKTKRERCSTSSSSTAGSNPKSKDQYNHAIKLAERARHFAKLAKLNIRLGKLDETILMLEHIQRINKSGILNDVCLFITKSASDLDMNDLLNGVFVNYSRNDYDVVASYTKRIYAIFKSILTPADILDLARVDVVNESYTTGCEKIKYASCLANRSNIDNESLRFELYELLGDMQAKKSNIVSAINSYRSSEHYILRSTTHTPSEISLKRERVLAKIQMLSEL